jgi:hypothetical protein
MSIAYNVYANSEEGDPIKYTSPVAVVTSGTSWNTSTLVANASYWLGVRAFDTVTGLEEENIDCVVEIVLDVNGRDITCRPLPPIGTRALAIAGGSIRVEWFYAGVSRSRVPVGFNLYIGAGTVPVYGVPAKSVAYAGAVNNTFYAIVSGLTDGVTYAIGVRAFNQSGEETNLTVVTATAKTGGPMPVVGLRASTIV